jgi:hypothetical protein
MEKAKNVRLTPDNDGIIWDAVPDAKKHRVTFVLGNVVTNTKLMTDAKSMETEDESVLFAILDWNGGGVPTAPFIVSVQVAGIDEQGVAGEPSDWVQLDVPAPTVVQPPTTQTPPSATATPVVQGQQTPPLATAPVTAQPVVQGQQALPPVINVKVDVNIPPEAFKIQTPPAPTPTPTPPAPTQHQQNAPSTGGSSGFIGKYWWVPLAALLVVILFWKFPKILEWIEGKQDKVNTTVSSTKMGGGFVPAKAEYHNSVVSYGGQVIINNGTAAPVPGFKPGIQARTPQTPTPLMTQPAPSKDVRRFGLFEGKEFDPCGGEMEWYIPENSDWTLQFPTGMEISVSKSSAQGALVTILGVPIENIQHLQKDLSSDYGDIHVVTGSKGVTLKIRYGKSPPPKTN